MRTNENNNKLNEIKEIIDEIVRKHLKSKTSRSIFNFQKFKTIISFGDDIIGSKITISETDEKQNILLNNTLEFNDKAKPKSEPTKEKKIMLMKV